MRYENVPQAVGVVVSSRLATLAELQSVYGTRDLYDFLEVIAVDLENRRRLAARGRED
jgi:hypothetical protein